MLHARYNVREGNAPHDVENKFDGNIVINGPNENLFAVHRYTHCHVHQVQSTRLASFHYYYFKYTLCLLHENEKKKVTN